EPSPNSAQWPESILASISCARCCTSGHRSPARLRTRSLGPFADAHCAYPAQAFLTQSASAEQSSPRSQATNHHAYRAVLLSLLAGLSSPCVSPIANSTSGSLLLTAALSSSRGSAPFPTATSVLGSGTPPAHTAFAITSCSNIFLAVVACAKG